MQQLQVLEFTAAWCGPCKAMAPVIAALATEYQGRARIEVVDVDRDPITAQQYDVRSVPALVLVRDGRVVGRAVGARPRAFVAGMIDRALAGDQQITAP